MSKIKYIGYILLLYLILASNTASACSDVICGTVNPSGPIVTSASQVELSLEFTLNLSGDPEPYMRSAVLYRYLDGAEYGSPTSYPNINSKTLSLNGTFDQSGNWEFALVVEWVGSDGFLNTNEGSVSIDITLNHTDSGGTGGTGSNPAPSVCHTDAYITQAISDGINRTFMASNDIVASSSISGDVAIRMEAGNSVVLKPGFHYKAPTTVDFFIAEIKDCSSSSGSRIAEEPILVINHGKLDTLNNFVRLKDTRSFTNKLQVYPNPANDYITLIHPFEESALFQIAIYNSNGLLVLDKNYSKNHLKIELPNFANGLYIVVIRHRDGMTIPTQLLIAK